MSLFATLQANHCMARAVVPLDFIIFLCFVISEAVSMLPLPLEGTLMTAAQTTTSWMPLRLSI
jgi:hypothetical protein